MSVDPRAKLVPVEWRGPLREWALYLAAAGRSVQTVATRTDHVRRAARAFGVPPAGVTASVMVAWCGEQGWARDTRRSVYASLRGFFGWAVGVGLVASSPAAALPAVKPSDPKPRPCPDLALRVGLSVASAPVRLALRLAAEAGLRRAEIVQVHARDLVPDLLGVSLLVHGKGGRERTVPLSAGLAAAVGAACGGGWAFPSPHGGHWSARWLGRQCADVLPDQWTLHSLRHRFGTRAYAASTDLLAVQRLLGHASPATTQRYVATDAERLRQVAAAAA